MKQTTKIVRLFVSRSIQSLHDPAQDPFDLHLSSLPEERLPDHIQHVTSSSWRISKYILDSEWKIVESSSCQTSRETGFDTVHDMRDLRVWLSEDPMFCTDALKIKQKLHLGAEKILPDFRGLLGDLAARIFNYQDLLYCDRSPENGPNLRSLTCLHAINHILKTRDVVIKNNARLARADALEDVEYRDQGFTRPKVLILLPTREICAKAIDTIVSLCKPEQQENRKRFQESYVQSEEYFLDEKPADFRELFAGNDDDMFRLGMKFTRKTLKYFSQFYNSDIIFASPLGLKMAMGTEDSKKRDHDFLSSIEIVIVDQTDALLMQNWEHVEYIFEHLNLQPKETHGCDFSRVRNWYLDGNSKYVRQTIILSAFNTPEINRLFGHYLSNVAGKAKIYRNNYEGSIINLNVQVKQTFSRYDTPQLTDDPDARFNYFSNIVIPSLTKLSKATSTREQGILIFIPSYMDFVRVRNFMANSTETQHISFGSISEYTAVREVARARSHFFSGRHAVLLYTGRAHHFRRYHIRGVRRVIMYALPDNPLFYKEIVGGHLGSSISEGRLGSGDASVRSLFSKWDALKLERIVGTDRFVSMLREKGGDTFEFL